MVRTIYSMLPDADALILLEPEELAGIVLEHIKSHSGLNQGYVNRYNFGLAGNTYSEFPSERQERVGKALMEAWMWLEREGLIAPKIGDTGLWFYVTKRGERIDGSAGIQAYRHSAVLPRKFLHPTIAQKCWSSFLRGEYDTCVFQGFKELEVAIRAAIKAPDDLLGTELARKAFATDGGALTNTTAPRGEREALGHMMAGALGSYKNPHSHRNVALSAEEAAEMVILASHLLKIVDARAAALIASQV